MKRVIKLFALFICLSFALGVSLPALTVHAQEANTVTVATGAANIRSGPSLSTTVLGVVYAGTVLPVSGQSGAGWWRVETSFGTGWISSRITIFRGNISTVPITGEPVGISAPSTVVAANGPVKVYSTPNENSFVVTIIPTGGSADIIGQTVDGGWFQVSTTAGNGFVSTAAIARRGPLEEVPLVTDPGPSFRGPTVQINTTQNIVNDAGQVIGSIPAGTTLPIIGRNADNTRWMIAVDAIGVGWINVSNVSIAGAASEVPVRSLDSLAGPPVDNAVHANATTIVDRKLFYANPTFTIVMLDGGLGTEVGIIGRTSDGLWLQVIVRSNVVWMVFSGITLNGDMAAIPITDYERPNRNHIVVNAYQLNVRSGPGSQYTVIATLDGGDTLKTTGVSLDRVWWRVEGDFGVGWVRTRYILFRGDINTIPVVTEPVGEIASATALTKGTTIAYTAANHVTQAGSLPANVEYVITGRNTDWTMYQLDTLLGLVWVDSNAIYFRGNYDVVPFVQ